MHRIYTDPSVMFLMRAASFTRASGRGLCPGNREFFGPCEMASRQQCHVGPKNSMAQPPPTCPSNGSAWIKNNYVQGFINHRCTGSFMYMSPQVTLKGQCHEMDIRDGLNILTGTFCVCADGFQGLSIAIQYNY
jgi:hypothetical protein